MPTRRTFLVASASAAVAATAMGGFAGCRPGQDPFVALPSIGIIRSDVDRFWIGPQFWANRFQDWRLRDGRVLASPVAERSEMRTLALLTSDFSGSGTGYLSVRTGLTAAGTGFTGFLLGAGAGALDYRAAALVQRSSSIGGGLLVAYEADGAVRFASTPTTLTPISTPPCPRRSSWRRSEPDASTRTSSYGSRSPRPKRDR